MWWWFMVGCGFLATDPCADSADLQQRLASKVNLYSPLTASLRLSANRSFRPVRLDVAATQPDNVASLMQVDSRGSIFFEGKAAQLGTDHWQAMLDQLTVAKPLLLGIDHQVKTVIVKALLDDLAYAGVRDLDLVFVIKSMPSLVDPGKPHPRVEEMIRSNRAFGKWKPVVGGPTTWDQCRGVEAFRVVKQRSIESAAERLSKLVMEEYVSCGCKPSAEEVVWEFAAQMPRAYHGVVKVRLGPEGQQLEGQMWVKSFEQLVTNLGTDRLAIYVAM